MTPAQAEQIANELLAQKRQAETDAKNASARRVPFAYYVRGLNVLEPWQRAELVQTASRHVANQWKVSALAVCLVLACCIAWWLFGLFARKDVPLVLLVFVIAAVAFLPRTYLVRQEIRKRLPRLSASQHERAGEV